MNSTPDCHAIVAASVRRLWRRAIVLLLVVLVLAAGLAALGWQKELSLAGLIRHRAAFEEFVATHYKAALVSFIACYGTAAALALPGVVFLTIGGGVFFGGLAGGIAAVTGATLGATAIFLIAKAALRSVVARRIGPHVAHFAEGFRENAFSYLLFLRLVPIFPFSLGTLLPALCDVPLGIFIGATFLGITPMTLAISFFGAMLDEALADQLENYRVCLSADRTDCTIDFEMRMVVTPQIVAALVGLGIAALLPVMVRRYKLQRNPSLASEADSSNDH